MGDEKLGDETFATGRGRVIAVEGEVHPETVASVHSTSAAGESAATRLALSEHSVWPAAVALGLLLIGVGILHQMVIAAIGAVLVLAALIGWAWEPWTS